ncbi:MAG: PilW family protein [Amphritea sp.]|nr:PilW family protein [Amphritea sp.]
MNRAKKVTQFRQTGLTMIELMIAMVIGLILTAAVLQVFVGSRVTYSTQASLARLQENGRFALEFLTRDIRQAGYQGCSANNSIASTIIDDGSAILDSIDLSEALVGWNNVGSGARTYGGRTALAGTDIIEVKFADTGSSCTVDSHNPTAASILCESPHEYQKGDLLVVSDCSHTGIFQQSNVNNNSTTATVVHNTGQASPGNCTKGLGLPVPSPCDSTTSNTNGTAYPFPPGASVMRFQSYRFFIANNDAGEPALYRHSLQSDSATLGYAGNAIELVEGIENMQLYYGEDTDGDGAPNRYLDAGTAGLDMDDVIAVRVDLLVQSNQESVVQGSQTLSYFRSASGAVNTAPYPADGRLRKVFSTTIALRNRL